MLQGFTNPTYLRLTLTPLIHWFYHEAGLARNLLYTLPVMTFIVESNQIVN